jgi:CheY-like chemotaxis protein
MTTAAITTFLTRLTKTEAPAEPRRPLRVLVVDDEEPIRRYVDRVLRQGGYQTVLAENGAAALRLASASEPFDLLLTDLNMPEIDGEKLARQLRAEYGHLPVLFLTGYSDRLFNERVVLADGEAFLEKPCTPKALLDALSLVKNTTYLDHHEPNPS